MSDDPVTDVEVVRIRGRKFFPEGLTDVVMRVTAEKKNPTESSRDLGIYPNTTYLRSRSVARSRNLSYPGTFTISRRNAKNILRYFVLPDEKRGRFEEKKRTLSFSVTPI